MNKVFVTYNMPAEQLSRLSEYCDVDAWQGKGSIPRDELMARVGGVDGIICLLTDRIDAELINASKNLKAISCVSVGVDHIDVGTLIARGIPLGHTPGVLVDATADLAFGLLLAAARRIPQGDRYARTGGWQGASWSPKAFLGCSVAGKTLGIIGLGDIGQAVARRAAGFDMPVIAWSRSGREVAGVRTLSLEQVLDQSDFVSINVALTEETRGLIDAAALSKMKPGAILINTARGGIVDERALAKALKEGRIAGAGFDVFEKEPVPPDNALFDAPNFIATPHIGSATPETRLAMMDLAVANMCAAMWSEKMPCCFNPEVYAGHHDN